MSGILSWVLVGLFVIYLIGVVLIFYMHVVAVPNVTLGLMLLRSLLWPIWVTTGWPHGTPLIMD